MAQTAQQKADVARELARRLYQSATANLNHDDLVAAVSAIDAAMDVLPPALGQALTVKQNLIASLPEPFKSGSTAQQKALVLMLWVMKETGLL